MLFLDLEIIKYENLTYFFQVYLHPNSTSNLTSSCNILVIFLISNLNCVFKSVDKTDLSMDKSVDKIELIKSLEPRSLVIDGDDVDNLFYPNEIKSFL